MYVLFCSAAALQLKLDKQAGGCWWTRAGWWVGVQAGGGVYPTISVSVNLYLCVLVQYSFFNPGFRLLDIASLLM